MQCVAVSASRVRRVSRTTLPSKYTFVPVIEQFAGIVRVLGTPVTLNYKVDIAPTTGRKNLGYRY